MKVEKVKRKWTDLSLFLGLAIFSFAVSYVYLEQNVFNGKEEFLPISIKTDNDSKFIKEGKLTFLNKNTKKRIVEIDIEIADTPYERATGLMYRRSMPNK